MIQAIPGPAREDTAGDKTALEKFRTQLALDRTTRAWIRTPLTFETFGFGSLLSGLRRPYREGARRSRPRGTQGQGEGGF
jgi:hypothetical protein